MKRLRFPLQALPLRPLSVSMLVLPSLLVVCDRAEEVTVSLPDTGSPSRSKNPDEKRKAGKAYDRKDL